MTNKQIERIVIDQLEQYTLEEFFEFFDLTPLDVVSFLYDEGFLREDILNSFLPVDGV